jgi:hypothetical protein
MDDSQLQELFDFDQADLAANRKCMLSTRQAKRIKQAESRNARLLIGIGMVSILIVVIIIYAVISRAVQQHNSLSNAFNKDTIGIVVEIGIPGLLFSLFAWGSFKMARRSPSHTVQQVHGKVSFVQTTTLLPEKQPNGSISYRALEKYDLQVGKIRFEDVNQSILSLIHNDDICIVYYVKESRAILSAELMPANW